MKRIEDKIREIQKKDKINRRLYMGVVTLIALFMFSVLYFGREISKREKTIAKREVTISAQKVEQSETYKKLDASFDSLRKSLRPREYWNHIKKEHSVEGYISYITNDWGIDKTPYLHKAFENLKSTNSEATGFEGWIWVGTKKRDGTYISKDIVEVVYRAGWKSGFKDSEVRKGDIVKLTTTRNRRTYKRKTLKRRNANSNGWRNKTKGYVTDVWKDPKSTNYVIKIKYY
ncbi:MAG: hypothetical protein AAF489_05110 [Bacteroidota bacterium]